MLNRQGIKPDLANVQSLGQYGFNMGENNDNVERMNRYYDEVITCTQDIRSILKDSTFKELATATFQ